MVVRGVSAAKILMSGFASERNNQRKGALKAFYMCKKCFFFPTFGFVFFFFFSGLEWSNACFFFVFFIAYYCV